MVDVHPGMLLVATPALRDPNFVDTVVMLLDADADGVLGVVLNRPSPLAVGAVLPPWAPVVTGPDVLFTGGPVSPEGALAVALLQTDFAGATAPVGFREVVGGLGLVDLDTPTELVVDSIASLRIFAGYAGWGAGQLAEEIQEGAWYVLQGQARDVFRPEIDGPGGVDHLWRDVLRRQPGDLAWQSTRPADADQN